MFFSVYVKLLSYLCDDLQILVDHLFEIIAFMKIKYSFIIPHKNCPDLLKRCVDSIPQREDIQIIIVDDNSDSGKKPDIKRDGVEIFLLNAENAKGAGRARNVGLQHAEGEWLLFADADDYFTDYLPTLLDKFVGDDHTDIVYLNACKFDENQVTKPFGTNKLIVNYLEGKKDADMHLKYDLWTPWSRMVRRSVVVDNAVAFDELPSANDKMFGLKCSFYAKSFKVEKEFVYKYYRPTTRSITDKQRNSKTLDDLLDLRYRTIELYKKAGYKDLPAYWGILHRSPYVRGLSFGKIFYKYMQTLKATHTCLISDQYYYYRKKIKARLHK